MSILVIIRGEWIEKNSKNFSYLHDDMFCNDFCIIVNKFSYGSTYRIGLLLLMGSVLTVCLTIGIVLCNARKIFDSKPIHKTRTKTVSTNKNKRVILGI